MVGDEFAGVQVLATPCFQDERGILLKPWIEKLGGGPIYEVYVVSCGQGQVRGRHYHFGTTEWFTPLIGRGRLHLRDPHSRKERIIPLDAVNPHTIKIPAGMAHALVGDSKNFVVIACMDRPHDPADVTAIASWVVPSTPPAPSW